MRSTVVRAAALVALVLLAGCGGTDAPRKPVPNAEDAVGGYRLTSEITRSTLPDNPAGAASKVATEAFLSCADDPCSTLLQRAAGTERPQGNTFHLEPRAGGFTGEHVRVGDCGGSTHGTYGESFTWSWDRAADGTLTGTLEQVFQGCGIDGTTTFTTTATPDPALRLPYLPATASDVLVAALNLYDVAVSAIFVSGAGCDTVPGSTTLAEAACFAPTYRDWNDAIEALATKLAPLDGTATGGCRTALGSLDLESWSAVVARASTLYAGAEGPTGIATALKAEEAATGIAETEHARLIEVAALCTDPRSVAALGTDGHLELDHGSVLQPLDDLG